MEPKSPEPQGPVLDPAKYRVLVPARKKRKLNYSSCHFCRKSKQKCLPIDRTWPDEDCNRCRRLKLPCSASETTLESRVKEENALEQRLKSKSILTEPVPRLWEKGAQLDRTLSSTAVQSSQLNLIPGGTQDATVRSEVFPLIDIEACGSGLSLFSDDLLATKDPHSPQITPLAESYKFEEALRIMELELKENPMDVSPAQLRVDVDPLLIPKRISPLLRNACISWTDYARNCPHLWLQAPKRLLFFFQCYGLAWLEAMCWLQALDHARFGLAYLEDIFRLTRWESELVSSSKSSADVDRNRLEKLLFIALSITVNDWRSVTNMPLHIYYHSILVSIIDMGINIDDSGFFDSVTARPAWLNRAALRAANPSLLRLVSQREDLISDIVLEQNSKFLLVMFYDGTMRAWAFPTRHQRNCKDLPHWMRDKGDGAYFEGAAFIEWFQGQRTCLRVPPQRNMSNSSSSGDTASLRVKKAQAVALWREATRDGWGKAGTSPEVGPWYAGSTHPTSTGSFWLYNSTIIQERGELGDRTVINLADTNVVDAKSDRGWQRAIRMPDHLLHEED